ncbi:hypothetical protein [Paludisphaera rhizosphaerae]|uniref:hypothetical protein n=1 Tax=Paludisphaera rhizosphaerae TaxID=2711216 RepID=UPI0013EAE484|nr:hypothetical protein [Paludisphaera rhizosphaerae]
MTPPDAPRRRWQVGVRTLILLTAAVAVGLTYALESYRIADLTDKLYPQSPLPRELVVDDPGRIAVVQAQFIYNSDRWDVYLPPGRRYRLCLATRGIEEGAPPPPPQASAPLEPGRHVIAMVVPPGGEGWRLGVSCDGMVVASTTEPKEWRSNLGGVGGSQVPMGEQSSSDDDRPVVLFRERFRGRDVHGTPFLPRGPTDGVALWIEPDSDFPWPGPRPTSSAP